MKTERKIDERGVLITLSIHPEDMGYVIGRQGQTARAIRTLLKIVGAKNSARVNLKINEPEGSTRGHRSSEAPSMATSGWDTGVDTLTGRRPKDIEHQSNKRAPTKGVLLLFD